MLSSLPSFPSTSYPLFSHPATHPLLPKQPSFPLSCAIKPPLYKASPLPVMQVRQYSATYPPQTIGTHCVLFGWWFSPWEL